jgi:hypothetical protein
MNTLSTGSGAYHPEKRPRRAAPGVLLLFILTFFLCTCASLKDAGPGQPPVAVQALRWPQAEEAFRHDRGWLGGDGAYSVVLGGGRVLWLFGDSFIGDGQSRDRHHSLVVRNAVAIQKGPDPASAKVQFFWKTRAGKPEAFFPAQGETWFWPGSGIMVQGRLLVFLMEIAPAQGALGFEPRGWAAALVPNPADEPGAWSMATLRVPGNPYGVIVGSACCLVEGDFLYTFGADARSHGAYLVRWKLADAARGDLHAPEWWTGKGGWVVQDKLYRMPEPLFRDAQMEFTVHYEPALGRYVEVQTGSFTDHCLVLRWSRSLTGPWSEGKRFYCPDGDEGLLVYAGKAHPGLIGGDLICTLAKNSLDPERLLDDDSLYYPVFIRGTYREGGE